MKALKSIVTILAVAAGTMTAWGQEIKKVDSYNECLAITDYQMSSKAVPQASVDSTCYLLGVNYGLMFKGNGFFDDLSQVNMNEFIQGLSDAMIIGEPSNPYGTDEEWASKFEISPYEMNNILNGYLAAKREYKMAYNEMLGNIFLAINATKPGVKSTKSRLQYIIHSEGEGEKILPTDTVVTNYVGYLLNGTIFDSNEDASFKADQVIKGWTEGLGLIGKGGKITLYIPAELAYGKIAPRGSSIEPNSLIIFEIEVLDVIHAEE